MRTDEAVNKWNEAVKVAGEKWKSAFSNGSSDLDAASMEAVMASARTQVSMLLEGEIESHVPENLRGPCLWLTRAGGKRVRALIPPMVCAACGGDPDDAVSAGLALELIHTFTLIHDDIMDEASERRLVDPVHVKFGTSTAINAGNVLFNLALDMLSKDCGEWAVRLTTTACMELGEGQQYDIDWKGVALPYDKYQKVIELKTAPLFRLAASLGALMAGADMNMVMKMEAWGQNFGLSFQARDDVLDRFEVGSGVNLQSQARIYALRALENLREFPESEWTRVLSKITKQQVGRDA